MLKPVLSIAAAGFVAVVLWKVLGLLLLPLVAMAFGLLVVVLKFAFIGAMICFAIWVFRRMTRTHSTA